MQSREMTVLDILKDMVEQFRKMLGLDLNNNPVLFFRVKMSAKFHLLNLTVTFVTLNFTLILL